TSWRFLNTLGVAAYRSGDWKTAEEALLKSIGINGGHAMDWFFLAMTRWRQGQQAEARKCFDQAVAWLARNPRNPSDDKELKRFHAEAAALLGLPGTESTPGTQKVERSTDPTPKKCATDVGCDPAPSE